MTGKAGQEKERKIGARTSLFELLLPPMLTGKRDAVPPTTIVMRPAGAFPFTIVVISGTGKLRGEGKGREDRADGCAGGGEESGGTEMTGDAGKRDAFLDSARNSHGAVVVSGMAKRCGIMSPTLEPTA